MKSTKFAALFSITMLFIGCAATHAKVLPVPPPQPPQLQHNRPPGFWENKQAVVQVKTTFTVTFTFPDASVDTQNLTMLGSGAVVNVNGLVITNNHVTVLTLKDLVEVFGPYIQFISAISPPVHNICSVVKGKQYCGPAKVVATDPGHDLAKLYTHQHFRRAVKFVDNSELAAGDELYFWGNVESLLPLSSFFGRYIGIVEPPYVEKDIMTPLLLPLLFVDVIGFQGSSGGPGFDELGRCIGLIVSGYTKDAGTRTVSVVIPSNTVMKFNADNPYPLPEK